MKVFKFGGASIADADKIKNVSAILSKYTEQNLVVVISALGKTTNALEELAYFTFNEDESNALNKFNEVKANHLSILNGLFEQDHEAFEVIEKLFDELLALTNTLSHINFNYYYDQIVSYGELLSTNIVSQHLNNQGHPNNWLDVRTVLKTDNAYREAKIDWDTSTKLILDQTGSSDQNMFITQGFIGMAPDGSTTTLGREGSDFSAGIFSYILDAEELVIWKDVLGVLNANPTLFEDVTKINDLPYDEAIEMTYYGAQVIHPKTIKPLQNKNIPLRVRSFNNLEDQGTRIHNVPLPDDIPCIIVYKRSQVLLTFTTKDFSFMAEDTLSKIYSSFGKLRIKSNIMQNAAISLTVCIDHNEEKVGELINELEPYFNIDSDTGNEVLTIRHYKDDVVKDLTAGKEILITQKTSDTVQFVIRAT